MELSAIEISRGLGVLLRFPKRKHLVVSKLVKLNKWCHNQLNEGSALFQASSGWSSYCIVTFNTKLKIGILL